MTQSAPPPDETKGEPRCLASARDAIRFLYEQSLNGENLEIIRIIREALTCCDHFIAERQQLEYPSSEAVYYFYFIKAMLGLPPQKIRHLIAMLKWMEIIPPCGAGETGD